jgi:hypothetical protein
MVGFKYQNLGKNAAVGDQQVWVLGLRMQRSGWNVGYVGVQNKKSKSIDGRKLQLSDRLCKDR